MSPRIIAAISRTTITAVCFLLVGRAHAIPTWIGVNGSIQRQAGGNPGTFTILMNQYYTTLHSSVGISVNGGNFREYAMTYDGMTSKNSKWSYTPAAVFPTNATIKYYFRGWDDAGGSISDGTAATGYSFVSSAPTVIPVAGEVDIFGAMISMGSWLDDLNRSVLYLTTSDLGTSSLIRFGATRTSNDWIWERGAPALGSSPVVMMKLDALNRLRLFDPTAGLETIVLDPRGPQAGVFINGERVLTTISASGSYLPLNPVQLSVGANNMVGADALGVGSSVQATGHNATALGSNTIAAGENSVAVGSYNIAQGVDDQLFVVGNGTDNSHRANAVTILRNGNMGVGTSAPTAKLEVNGDTNLHGDLTVDGVIRVMPQGDLSMGEFTQSPTP